MQLLIRWAISAGALYATVWILSLEPIRLARFRDAPWYAWFLAVVIMALVNALIRPVLSLLTLPLNCLTFGLVGLIINGLMFWLVPVLAEAAGMPVFTVTPLGAFLGAILVGVIGGIASSLVVRDDEKD